MGKIDLHTHSTYSDGDKTPGELAQRVREAGVDFWALSDHDCVDGVDEAILSGKELGITVVPGVEFDNEFDQELHILGLCVDHHAPVLVKALQEVSSRRAERNNKIVKKLADAGYEIAPYLESDKQGVITRLHIAAALLNGGYVREMKDGFSLMKPGAPGHVRVERLRPSEVISIIKKAGGIPVVAHPCHLRGNVRSIIAELIAMGVEGLEAYYTTSTPGQTTEFQSIASQNGLIVTCGSDYHGARRPKESIGCSYCDIPELARTRRILEQRLVAGR